MNFQFGDVTVPEKFLLDCSEIETVNHQVVAPKKDNTFRKMNIPREKFVRLLSDAASNTTAAIATLKTLYPNLFHVTCVTHMLHNCSETSVLSTPMWIKSGALLIRLKEMKFCAESQGCCQQ